MADTLNCALQPLGEDQVINVGTPLTLICEGSFPDFNETELELRVDEKDKYKLRMLSFQKKNSSEAMLVVTSYQAGTTDVQAAQLVDNTHSVVLSPISFQVQSVINPQEPPEGPYPPRGAISFSLPLWYWLAFAAVILAAAVVITLAIKRRRERKRQVDAVMAFGNHLSPHNQFHSTLRHMRKKYSFLTGVEDKENKVGEALKELDQSFRIYIGRSFKTPSLTWKDGAILKDIRKNHEQTFESIRDDLRQGLFELSRAQKKSNDLPGDDVRKLMLMLTKNADQIESRSSKARKSL